MTLKETLAQNRQRYEEELVEFLKIPSVSARSEHKPDMQRCADWLAGKMSDLGVIGSRRLLANLRRR